MYSVSVHLGNDNKYQNESGRDGKNQTAFAWLDWDCSHHPFLGPQLDPARSAHQLGVFPDVAGLLSCHGWVGVLAHEYIPDHA